MKKWKAMTGLETALTTECSASGCGAVMAEAIHRTAGRQRIRYVDWGKGMLTLILLAGLLIKFFSSSGIASFIQVNETVSIPQLSWGNNRCKWR